MGLFEKMKVFEDVIDALAPTVSLVTFFDAISEGIDEHIRSQRSVGKSFLGGKTYFSLSEDSKNILIEVKLYYIAEDDSYKKQEFSGNFYFSRIHTSEQQDFIDMLSSDGRFCIEVSEPEQEEP